jgi:predicted ester cyclase|tara:strand:+ start:289 stop:516 length:228 start_codon:yes stop_codon:yes gene_type:complete
MPSRNKETMITIDLVAQNETPEDVYTDIEVNGKLVHFCNKVLTGISKGRLTEAEQKAAIWFVNSTLKIRSSIIYE